MSRLSTTSASLALSAILDDNTNNNNNNNNNNNTNNGSNTTVSSISSKSTISNSNNSNSFINIHVSPTHRKATRLTMQSYFDKENNNRLSSNSDKLLSPKSQLTPLKQSNQNLLNRQSLPNSIISSKSFKSVSTTESVKSPLKRNNINRRSHLSQSSKSTYSSYSSSKSNNDINHLNNENRHSIDKTLVNDQIEKKILNESNQTNSSSTQKNTPNIHSKQQTADLSSLDDSFQDETLYMQSESTKSIRKSSSFRTLRNSLSMKSLASTLNIKQDSNLNSNTSSNTLSNNNPTTNHPDRRKSLNIKMKKKMSLENIRSFLSNNRYSMSYDNSNDYKNNISLPIMQPQTKDKIRNRLRNSTSIVSISSFTSDDHNTTIHSNASSHSTNNINHNHNNHHNHHHHHNSSIPVDVNHLNILLKLCNQQKIISFKSYMNKYQASNNRKHLTLVKNNVTSDNLILHEFTTNNNINMNINININDHENSFQSDVKYSSVWKIIPFDLDNSTMSKIIQELALTIAMSTKEGFVSIISATVVSGSLPNSIIDIIDNNYPNLNSNLNSNDHYLIMKLKYGGISLNKFKIQSWQDASIIFKNILNTICIGSNENYEHRDLNFDNILIKQLSNENDESNKFQITIIDHALARGIVSNQLMFRNLFDAEFFKGNGEYRHTIYKLMRRAASSSTLPNNLTSSTNSSNSSISHSISTLSINTLSSDTNIDWSKSYPIFDLLWVHYLLHIIIYEKNLKPIKMNPIMKRNGRSMNNSNEVTKEIIAYERLLQGYRMVEPAVLFGHRKNKFMRHVNNVHEFKDWFLGI